MDPSDIQLGRAWRHSIAEQTGSVLCWHIFLCLILSSCHVALVYFSREAMNFTVYTLLPSSVWLSQHVLHWLTCKLRTWMVYSNSICSLVSGIEMGIGKTRLSLPHFSMSSSMVFLIYDVPKIVASAKKLQLLSPPHACSLSPIANFHLFANVTLLVTRIVEVLQIAVMGWKFFHVMVPLEDMVKFMDTNMVRIRVLVCQV